MLIGTGYFAKVRDYAKDGWALVSIALKDAWFLPNDLKITSLKELAPNPDILQLKDNPEQYEARYREEILSKVDWVSIYKRLSTIAKEEKKDKVVLLCYESPEKFCHRHIVAKWFGDKTGSTIKEIPVHPTSSSELFESDSVS